MLHVSVVYCIAKENFFIDNQEGNLSFIYFCADLLFDFFKIIF